MRKLNDADAQRMLDWRHGRLGFNGAPLHEVIEELNLFSAKRIVIIDPATANFSVSGFVETERMPS